MTYGESMRAARRVAGLSIRELSVRSGVSENAISQYERDICAPTLPNVDALATVLGVTIDSYVGKDDEVTGIEQRISDAVNRLSRDVGQKAVKAVLLALNMDIGDIK